MYKHIFIFVLIAGLIFPVAGQWGIAPPPQTTSVEILTDRNGTYSVESGLVKGELLGLLYLNGNFSGDGLVVVEDTNGIQIDSYNVSSGDVYRVPGLKISNSTDAWRPFPITTPLWFNLTEQQGNATATVQITYR